MIFHEYKSKKIVGEIFNADALEFLQSLKSEEAGIIFLDPPFNLGKHYSDADPRIDRKPEAEYEKWLSRILDEATRVLMPGGALYLYHLPYWAMRLGAHLQANLEFRHWIAISMKNGFVRGRRLYPAHYSLLYFTKGPPLNFNRPKLTPSKCRHCGEYIKDYGGYKSIIDQQGINLSDFWEDLSPVRHANRKHRTENELPVALMERVIKISGVSGLTYVDPFAGSGSGVIAAINSGLVFKACDIVRSNCDRMAERIENLRKLINSKGKKNDGNGRCEAHEAILPSNVHKRHIP